MEFLVPDAERMFGEGSKVSHLSFWSYKIMCRVTLPEYQQPPLFPKRSPEPPRNFIAGEGHVDYCTWHRYSDIEWFRDHMAEEFPGAIMPPLPDKDEGTKDKFRDLFSSKSNETSRDCALAKLRIRRLQMFFDFLSTCAEMHLSTHMKAFVSMEEPEWLAYKHEVEQRKLSGWDRFKESGSSFITSILQINEKKAVVFAPESPFARMRQSQMDMSNLLQLCFRNVEAALCVVQQPMNELSTIDDIFRPNGGKPLPPTLAYYNHLVHVGEGPSVVRCAEGDVEVWTQPSESDAPLVQHALSDLLYPAGGISDPAAFAISEMMTQVDSSMYLLCHRPDIEALVALVDMLWYWHRYSRCVVVEVDRLETIERQRLVFEKEASKKSDVQKKAALETRVATLRQQFTDGCARLERDYATFRERQRGALHDISMRFGNISHYLLTDLEWEQRLARATAALPLQFSPPEGLIASPTPSPTVGETVTSPARPAAHPIDDEFPSVVPPRATAPPRPVSPTPSAHTGGWGEPNAPPATSGKPATTSPTSQPTPPSNRSPALAPKPRSTSAAPYSEPSQSFSVDTSPPPLDANSI